MRDCECAFFNYLIAIVIWGVAAFEKKKICLALVTLVSITLVDQEDADTAKSQRIHNTGEDTHKIF